MEFLGTENAYLRAWFRSQKSEASAYSECASQNQNDESESNFISPVLPGRQDANLAFQESLAGSVVGSPRRSHLRDAGHRTIANGQFSTRSAA